jgi:hypothetical protein
METINAISKELGVLTGEFVDKEAAALKNDIKESIIKERKAGNFSLGRSIDVSKLSSFNERIDQLSNLAENSRNIDKIYRDAEQSVMSSNLISAADKPLVLNQIMRGLVDEDRLAGMNASDMIGDISETIKAGADINKVISSIVGDAGEKSVSITDANGNSVSKRIPGLLQMNNDGLVEFSEGGFEQFAKAYERSKQLGYGSGVSLEVAANRYLENQNTAFTKKDRFSDPLDEDYKRMRNRAMKAKLEEAKGNGEVTEKDPLRS